MFARRDRQMRLVRGLVMVLGMAVLALTAAQPGGAVPGPAPRPDAYMRDQPSDFGFEPFAGSVWNSPDIKICDVPNPACVPTSPKVGSTSYVVVTLHNPGPKGSGDPVSGDLKLYYTALGGAASWPGDWTHINTLFGLTVPAGATTVIMPWPNVPGPGHFCLLARWVSAADPMTFAEGVNSNTVTNTKNNNNIAWKNLNSVAVSKKEALVRPFTIRNPSPEPGITNLVVSQPEQPFVNPGRLIVDLGPTLAKRWKRAGAPGVGVQLVGDTEVEILDPREARIQHLQLDPRESIETRLTFIAGDAAGQYVVDAFQTDRSNVDIGGARFEITVQ